jgi:hypothetical protein
MQTGIVDGFNKVCSCAPSCSHSRVLFKKTKLLFCSAIVALVEETKARYNKIVFKTLDLVWLTLLLLITTSFLPTHRNYYARSDGDAMGWRMGGGGVCDLASGEEATQGKYQGPDSCYHGDRSVPAFLCSYCFSLGNIDL